MAINYADIIIIALAFIFCVVGYCRGFLRSITKLMGSFLSLIIAIFLCNSVTMLLCEKTPLYSMMTGAFEGWFKGMSPIMTEPINQENGVSLISQGLSAAGVPSFMIGWLSGSLAKLIPAGMDTTIAILLGQFISIAILRVCVTILLFALIRTLVFFLNKIIGLFLKDKLLKLVDRVFGVAFGALQTLLVVFVVFALGSYFIEQPYAVTLKNQIDSGMVSSVLYKNNPVKALMDRYVNLDNLLEKLNNAINPPSEKTPDPTPETSPEQDGTPDPAPDISPPQETST